MQSRDTDLHVYLERGPDVSTFSDLLSLHGFTYNKTVNSASSEPVTDYFKWKLEPLSGSGFKLLFFHNLFPDDLNVGRYEAFVIMCGDSNSSDEDLNMIDVTALLLLSRYGGRLHNPQRIDKISTSFLLSGKNFSGFSSKSH